MDNDPKPAAHLPVPMSPYGPLDALAARVHDLTQTSRAQEALVALDVYEPIALAFGDEKTASFLLQSRMYAYLNLGMLPEALATGEKLLSRHEATGATVAMAKTLADLARAYFFADQVGEAIRCLARAELLLQQTSVRNDRYLAALASLMGAAANAELYETARSFYQQVLQHWTPPEQTDASPSYDFIYAEMLLEWGLRLDQLDDHVGARTRLQTAAEIFARWCRTSAAATDQRPWSVAPYAVALAKIGEVDRGLDLAAGIVLPLRAQGDWYRARQAHLALGIALRAKADAPKPR